ncbi:MAG: MoaD/ThiS family protein [Deltaproteobacteria bacterium]|nr:MoaD/ThiS family protein [Deltaproteobacteria bacterium]MBW2136609.1 MoaD/ThiS family protein [Deltaproteobacteria bacterium]
MNESVTENGPEHVSVTVKFVSTMQKYSGDKREIAMDLPGDPARAINIIIDRYQIPWADNLERIVRIFINQTLYELFVEKGERLKDKDTIAFIPLSGGG